MLSLLPIFAIFFAKKKKSKMKHLVIKILVVFTMWLSGWVPAHAATILPSRDTIVVKGSMADTVMVVTDSICPAPSIRTNLAYLATSSANLGFEIPVSDNFSLGANLGLKSWPRWLPWDTDATNPTKWRHILIVPELRWWPEGMYERWFMGADMLYTHYNVGAVRFPFGLYPEARTHRFQGDLYALGLFAGYSWRLGDHLRLETEAGVAAGYNNAGKYECAHCGARIGNAPAVVVVPKVGLNLSVDFSKRYTKQEILEIINQSR